MAATSNILKTEAPIPCPLCGELFRLPEGMNESTSLACPHCSEEISGQQIIETLVPTAEIIQSSSTRPQADTPGSQVPVASRHEFDQQSYTIPKPLKTAHSSLK